MKTEIVEKVLDEICIIGDGNHSSNYPTKDELVESGIPFIRATNLVAGRILATDMRFLSPGKHMQLKKGHLKTGDILITNRGEIGKTAIVDSNYDNANLNSQIAWLRCREGVCNRFLFHFLNSESIQNHFQISKNGAALQQFTIKQLKALTIPIPPLPEQQRIVGILDEAFASIAIAKANAEKNLQNARALFESHLQAVFSQHGEGWMENNLKSLTSKIGSGATPLGGEEAYKVEGISLIRSLNVYDLGFRYKKLAFIDDTQAERLSNVIVERKDVLLNITGASVTRCCVVPEDVLPARVNQHVSIIRPISNKLDAEFLHYLLISKPYKDLLLQTGEEGGSTRQAITKAQIQEFKIVHPKTLKEQQTIVANLDTIASETQRLESIYQQKLAALDALKKSLLHQAFSGQL